MESARISNLPPLSSSMRRLRKDHIVLPSETNNQVIRRFSDATRKDQGRRSKLAAIWSQTKKYCTEVRSLGTTWREKSEYYK